MFDAEIQWFRAVVWNELDYTFRVVPSMAAFDVIQPIVLVSVAVPVAYWFLKRTWSAARRARS